MAFEPAIDITSFLSGIELSSSSYVSNGSKVYTSESLDLSYFTESIEFSEGNYISDGAKSFSQESVDLTTIFSNIEFGVPYVTTGIKSFTTGVIIHFSTRPKIPGDTGQEIVFGYYVEFSAAPRRQRQDKKVQFTDQTFGPEIASRLWTFGDGETSASENPEHRYHNKGLKTVRLDVVSIDGEPASLTKSDYINIIGKSRVIGII
jgi:hypothetical protein